MSALTRVVAGIVVLMTFGVLGVLMAMFPRETNRLRQRLPGQLQGPDWYIRVLGILVSVLAVGWAVLVVFLAK